MVFLCCAPTKQRWLCWVCPKAQIHSNWCLSKPSPREFCAACFGRQRVFWQTMTNLLNCNQTKRTPTPSFKYQYLCPFLSITVCLSVLYSKCTNQIQLHPVISPAPSNLSRETKLPLMSLPNRETSNFLVFTSREMAQKIGCILSGWIITIHSDALRAANASYRPIFLGSEHIRVWTPVMTTLQPCWYPVTTSSRNQNVRLEEGGWIIDAVSFGFAHFTKQKKKKFLAFMACSKTLSLPGTAFSF